MELAVPDGQRPVRHGGDAGFGAFDPSRSAVARCGSANVQPRPTNGIFVAITVMNCTSASSGRFAIYTIASATCWTSMRGSTFGAIGLQHAFVHACGHLGGGVADIDLAAGDIEVRPSREIGFRQSGDGVLGGGVGRVIRPRRVGGDRAVIDDAAAARVCAFIMRMASWAQRKAPVRLTATTEFHCS